MLVAGTVPWSLCILQENRGTGGGVGVGMLTFINLHTREMLRTQNWGSLALGKHRRSKLAKLEKNASFALWKTNSFCRATRNYIQFCNRMCLLVTGTWRRRDLLVYWSVSLSRTTDSFFVWGPIRIPKN